MLLAKCPGTPHASAHGGSFRLGVKMLDTFKKNEFSDLLETVFGGREFHSLIVVGKKLLYVCRVTNLQELSR